MYELCACLRRVIIPRMKSLNYHFSLEKLGLEVDREYKNLNKWYEKADTFNTWIYFNEKTIDEESSGSRATDIPAVKEQMEKNQVLYAICGNLFQGAVECDWAQSEFLSHRFHECLTEGDYR